VYTSGAKRWSIGGGLWALSALLLRVQLIALQRPDEYSLTHIAISDLGVTSCGVSADGGAQARTV